MFMRVHVQGCVSKQYLYDGKLEMTEMYNNTESVM